MSIASDLFRTVTVKIHDISQQLPYIVVNQADDNGKIIRFVPLDHGQKVTGFTGARLYYPPRSDNEYGDYVTGVESDGAWDFTIPVGVLSAGRVGCNLAFIDGDGETYSRNVVFLVEPAVSGVFDPEDGQQTRLDKIIGTVQDAADTAIDSVNNTADNAVENINQTARDAVESIGKAEESISESVTDARGSAEAAANSAQQAAASASAAQTSERNAANSATQASQSATAAKQSEDNAAESERNAAESERNAARSAEQAANIVASVSGSVTQAENAARSASQSSTAAAGSASAAGGSAQAAADSASKAGESATAAKASETNAASSASAAKVSETNAAASATAAQNAVDGFGLEVGTTTTGDPGTDAIVNIVKQGTKYVADFTIPRGEQGEPSPVVTDNTLKGSGISSDKLAIGDGASPMTTLSSSSPDAESPVNVLSLGDGFWNIDGYYTNLPDGYDATANIHGKLLRIKGSVTVRLLWISKGAWGEYPKMFRRATYSGSDRWMEIVDSYRFLDMMPERSVITKQMHVDSPDPESPMDIGAAPFNQSGMFSLDGYFSGLPSEYQTSDHIKGWYIYGRGGPSHTDHMLTVSFLFIYKVNIWGYRQRVYSKLIGLGNTGWQRVMYDDYIQDNYVPLSTYRALETRVQALEAKLASQ